MTHPVTGEIEIRVELLHEVSSEVVPLAPESAPTPPPRYWSEPYLSDSTPMTEDLWLALRAARVAEERALDQRGLLDDRLMAKTPLGAARDGLRTERRLFEAYERSARNLPHRRNEAPYPGCARGELVVGLLEGRATMLKARLVGALPYSTSSSREYASTAELEGRIRALTAALADSLDLSVSERASIDALNHSFFAYRDLVANREAAEQAGAAQAHAVRARVGRGLTEEHLGRLRTYIHKVRDCL